MTELEELKASYKELGKKIENMEKPKGRWKPEVGQDYYCISFRIHKSIYNNDYLDNSYYDAGNAFETHELATNEFNRRLATQRVLDIIAEERGDWKPVWGVDYNSKWSLTWNHHNCCLEFDGSAGPWQTLPDSHYCNIVDEKRIRARISDEDAKLFCGVE